MDRNIAFVHFASTWFKIFSGLSLVAGALLTILLNIPGVIGLVLTTNAYGPRAGGGNGIGLAAGAVGIVFVAIQLLGVGLISFILYTIARVLELLADIGDEIFDLRRIRFEQSNPRRGPNPSPPNP